ncbi:carbamoyltransferase [Helicobacter sp.]|uniref:carbamoyltransferase family protein n=1 Tax=Helicobacter sp. TaxID=218 RepID=UPI00388F507C
MSIRGGGGENNCVKSPLQNLAPAKSTQSSPKSSATLDSTLQAQTSPTQNQDSQNAWSLESFDSFVFYDKPFLTFERLLETYFATAPRGFLSFIRAIPVWLSIKLFLKETIARELESLYIQLYPHAPKSRTKAFKKKVLENLHFCEHHLSHCGSAFFPSPFAQSAILSLDGIGEWSTTTIAKGVDNHIEILKELHFPHSLGLLYSAFTYYLGFKVNSGEYKVMGLAPYGMPRFVDTIKQYLIDIKPDGSFALNMEYFSYTYGLRMTNAKFDRLFGGVQRAPESRLTQVHMDIAASLQAITEEIMLSLSRTALKLTNSRNLTLSGGVALNCVGNGKIYQKLCVEEGILDNLWIQPASGDAGSALGCALSYYYMECGKPRATASSYAQQNSMQNSMNDSMKGSYLGLSYTNDEVRQSLDSAGAVYEYIEFSRAKEVVAELLAQGKVVGFHQGRCEFGPRALGARSILGDPRNTTMQKTMNLKIKYRESFRPFAPSVLESAIAEWFELDYPSPYMLLVAPVKRERCFALTHEQEALFGIEKLNVVRSEIPSVTHVDYSARIQSVSAATNPRYYALIEEFAKRTGVPVLINTSFNVRGEPMVCSPLDSFACFMGTEIDVLWVEDFLLYKEHQNPQLLARYRGIKDKYELD